MMNNEKEKDAIDTSKLDEILPKYDPLKLNSINLAQNYVSAFNTGMNIYQCVNQLQGYIEWVVKAVNDVVKSWNVQVGESIDQSKAIVRETTKEQFNVEWTNKQPELIEQVNTLTTNQFNEDWGVLENRINTTLETQNTNIQNIQNEQNELETNTNNNINAQNTKINSIQTQQTNLASNQTNLANQQTTLSNRMDTFTSLTSGSTTGDAELQDIRVGANGITYNTAGDAVRGQYSQLKEDLIENSKVFINPMLINNSYIDSMGAIKSYDNWSRTDYTECKSGDTLYIYSILDSVFNCFYNKDKRAIQTRVKINKGYNTITVPSNASFYILSNTTEAMENIKIFPTDLSFELEQIKKTFITENDVYRLSDNIPYNIDISYNFLGYLDITNGNFVANDSWKASDFITLDDVSAIYISIVKSSQYATYYNCFYDSSKTFISNFDSKSGYVNVPKNAKYVRFSCRSDETQTIKFVSRSLYQDNFKVCSFNTGLYYDGVRKPQNDEEIKQAEVNWHRFLGEFNPDFLLTEESKIYIDNANTINAYDNLIKFKLPYKEMLSDTNDVPLENQIGAYSKMKINDFKMNAFKSGSGRPFITFNSLINGKRVNFIIVHLSIEDNSSGARQQDLIELRDLMRTYDYGVLTGDFNTYNIDEFNVLSEFNMANHGDFGEYDTWHSKSETSTWNECLDNIVTTKSLSIQNVEMFTKYIMSDHNPIMAELKFE